MSSARRPRLHPLVLAVLLIACHEVEPPAASQVDEWVQAFSAAADRAALDDRTRARVAVHGSVALYEGLRESRSDFQSLAGQLNGLWSVPPATARDVDAAIVAGHAIRIVLDSLLPAGRASFDSLADRQIAARQAAGVPSATSARSLSHAEALARSVLGWAASAPRTFVLRHAAECVVASSDAAVEQQATPRIGMTESVSAIAAAEAYLLNAVAIADAMSAAPRASGSPGCVTGRVRTRLRTRMP